MRALPLWQPWADLVVSGAKRVETRPRPISTIVGERVAIHATITRDHIWRCATSPFCEHLPDEDIMWFGALIGTVRVVRADEMTEAYVAEMRVQRPAEFAFGDYAPGRWAFDLEAPERFREPIPWKGSQGIFFVPDEALGYEPSQAAQGVLL